MHVNDIFNIQLRLTSNFGKLIPYLKNERHLICYSSSIWLSFSVLKTILVVNFIIFISRKSTRTATRGPDYHSPTCDTKGNHHWSTYWYQICRTGGTTWENPLWIPWHHCHGHQIREHLLDPSCHSNIISLKITQILAWFDKRGEMNGILCLNHHHSGGGGE
jgi:hypothetical protein